MTDVAFSQVTDLGWRSTLTLAESPLGYTLERFTELVTSFEELFVLAYQWQLPERPQNFFTVINETGRQVPNAIDLEGLEEGSVIYISAGTTQDNRFYGSLAGFTYIGHYQGSDQPDIREQLRQALLVTRISYASPLIIEFSTPEHISISVASALAAARGVLGLVRYYRRIKHENEVTEVESAVLAGIKERIERSRRMDSGVTEQELQRATKLLGQIRKANLVTSSTNEDGDDD